MTLDCRNALVCAWFEPGLLACAGLLVCAMQFSASDSEAALVAIKCKFASIGYFGV